MAETKFTSLDAFLDDVAFDLWTKDRVATLSLRSSAAKSSGGIDFSFEWTYEGKVPKTYRDGFFCTYEDARDSQEMRDVASELKEAYKMLIKKGVVTRNGDHQLALRPMDSMPTGAAAEILRIAERKLIPLGKTISASELFAQGRRYGLSERQIYENICAYFSK